MPMLTGAPACRVLAALVLHALAPLLCCCPCRSCLTTAWTPKEGKGTKPDLESRSSGNFSSRPTLCPAVRSSTVLPLGYRHCWAARLTPASPTIIFMATHIPPATGSDGNGPVDAPRATRTRDDEQHHSPPLGLSAGASRGEQLPGGKHGAWGLRCCLQDACRCCLHVVAANRQRDGFPCAVRYLLLTPRCHKARNRTCLPLIPSHVKQGFPEDLSHVISLGHHPWRSSLPLHHKLSQIPAKPPPLPPTPLTVIIPPPITYVLS